MDCAVRSGTAATESADTAASVAVTAAETAADAAVAVAVGGSRAAGGRRGRRGEAARRPGRRPSCGATSQAVLLSVCGLLCLPSPCSLRNSLRQRNDVVHRDALLFPLASPAVAVYVVVHGHRRKSKRVQRARANGHPEGHAAEDLSRSAEAAKVVITKLRVEIGKMQAQRGLADEQATMIFNQNFEVHLDRVIAEIRAQFGVTESDGRVVQAPPGRRRRQGGDPLDARARHRADAAAERRRRRQRLRQALRAAAAAAARSGRSRCPPR